MQPFPINRAWIPSVVSAAVIVGFLVFNRRGPLFGEEPVHAAPAPAPAALAATVAAPADDASAGIETSIRPVTGDGTATPSDAPAAPVRTARAGAPAVPFDVEVRPSATSRGASDVFVGGVRIGTLDRLGRKPCLFEVTRLARAAAKSADAGGADLRASVRTAAGTDGADASEILTAVTAGGVRGVALDGAALFGGGNSRR